MCLLSNDIMYEFCHDKKCSDCERKNKNYQIRTKLIVFIYVKKTRDNGLVSNLRIRGTNDVLLWHATKLLCACGSMHHRWLIMEVDSRARQATEQPCHSWYVDMRLRRGTHIGCRCESGETVMCPHTFIEIHYTYISFSKQPSTEINFYTFRFHSKQSSS